MRLFGTISYTTMQYSCLSLMYGGLGQAKVMGFYNLGPSFTGIQHVAKRPLAGLSDILEAFDSLSTNAAEGYSLPETSSATFGIAWANDSQYTVSFCPNEARGEYK